jgi:hypothetical protein
VLSSALIDQLAEYSVPGQTIGHGSFIGTVTITQPTLSHAVTNAAIQTTLQQQINSNSSVPKPDAGTLYFIYLPPGTAVVQGGSRSCQAFCGYHDTFGSGIYYAVMPFPNCSGRLGGMASLDALTSTSSHELCEAITDPVPGQGWYDDTHGEIGDICACGEARSTFLSRVGDASAIPGSKSHTIGGENNFSILFLGRDASVDARRE